MFNFRTNIDIESTTLSCIDESKYIIKCDDIERALEKVNWINVVVNLNEHKQLQLRDDASFCMFVRFISWFNLSIKFSIKNNSWIVYEIKVIIRSISSIFSEQFRIFEIIVIVLSSLKLTQTRRLIRTKTWDVIYDVESFSFDHEKYCQVDESKNAEECVDCALFSLSR